MPRKDINLVFDLTPRAGVLTIIGNYVQNLIRTNAYTPEENIWPKPIPGRVLFYSRPILVFLSHKKRKKIFNMSQDFKGIDRNKRKNKQTKTKTIPLEKHLQKS